MRFDIRAFYWLSHLRAFCRQIHQCARIGGWEGGVKPILEMPGFWKRLSLQALPKGGTENIQSFVTFWLWTVSLRVHLLIRKPSQHLIAEFVLKNWTILKGPVQQKHQMRCHSCCRRWQSPIDKKAAPQFRNEITALRSPIKEVQKENLSELNFESTEEFFKSWVLLK